MIVQETQRGSRSDSVSIQVGKHLLTSLQSDIQKEDYRNRFITQIGVLLQRLSNGRLAMLTVVDDKFGTHWNTQRADASFCRGVT